MSDILQVGKALLELLNTPLEDHTAAFPSPTYPQIYQSPQTNDYLEVTSQAQNIFSFFPYMFNIKKNLFPLNSTFYTFFLPMVNVGVQYKPPPPLQPRCMQAHLFEDNVENQI